MYKLGWEPSKEGIQGVVAATGCNPSRAKIYLRANQNDVNKAISQYQTHRRSFSSLKSNAQKSPNLRVSASSVSSASISEASTGETEDSLEQARPSNTPRTKSDDARIPLTVKNIEERSSLRTAEGDEDLYPKPLLLRRMPVEQNSTVEEDAQSESVVSQRTTTTTDGDTHKEAYMEADEALADSSTWNFMLPILPPPNKFGPGGQTSPEAFSIWDLVAAIQHSATADQIWKYISHFAHASDLRLRDLIDTKIKGFPAMFYVVGANNEAIVRLFAQVGGDVNATYGTPPVPLLAFALINSKAIGRDTTSMVITLLSLGANVDVVPRAFYYPFDQDLPPDGPNEQLLLEDFEHPEKLWCESLSMRQSLVATLNVTQRYYLHRSSKLMKPTGRQKDVAARNESMNLFGIPYFLIGQSAATELLTQSFLHYMLRRQEQPLVLVFAGPSGHGKTELARRLGSLLSLDLHVSDCAIVGREHELFGSRNPYVGAEEGSPLNNFLAAHDGRKCIVFLDEFEKTTQSIWNALLLPFDRGEYQDRRNLKTINCVDTIWILATNALDKRIASFYQDNEVIFDEADLPERDDLLEELTSKMKDDFMSRFSPTLTGRISGFVPFLPFSSHEASICAHKYLLELMNEVRRPVCITTGPQEHLIGNVRLNICNDSSVCKFITKDYDPSLGARSLRKAVRDRVASPLDNEYLATHEVISEGMALVDFSVSLVNGRIKVKRVMNN